MTKRLIENWLPIAELGEESIRERRSMTALPPTYYLHVWWARRPLVASRAAVLASILPEDADKEKFVHALGIHGDPVKAKINIAKATREGRRLGADAYGYQRAFSYLPSANEKDWIDYESSRIGIDRPLVLDPTAGGGSIPFESIRLGLSTQANDLNPIAALIEKATIQWPLLDGLSILKEFERIGVQFVSEVRKRLTDFFPPEPYENWRPDGYLWSRTITCPYCDGLIPLSPNWRLAPGGTGVRLIPQTNGGPNTSDRFCRFEIVDKAKDQSEGTVARGRATCPFPDCGRIIDGDEIKSQAQAGNMGEQLFCVIYKERVVSRTKTGREREKWVRGYRAPRPEDDVKDRIRQALEEKLPEWEALDIIPNEAYPHLFADRSKAYGVNYWRDLFSPRQLLCHGTSVEVFRELFDQEQNKPGFSDATKAAFGYLALSIDKLITYNCRLSRWIPQREVMEQIFAIHAFRPKWSYAEMAHLVAGSGYDWVINQTSKCLAELIDLARPDVQAKKSRKGRQQGKLPLSENYTPPQSP